VAAQTVKRLQTVSLYEVIYGNAPLTKACAPSMLGDSKFVELLKNSERFNHEINDKKCEQR